MVDPAHLDMGNASDTPTLATVGSAAGGVDGADVGTDAAGFSCVLEALPLDPRGRGTIVVLRMVGEIDLATVAPVKDALHCGLQADARSVLVDLAGVRFCGACGFAAIAAAARTAAAQQTGYALSGLSPHLHRVATTLWESDGPPRYRSAAAAVTAIRAARPRG